MARLPNPMNYASSWETAGTGNPAVRRFLNSVYAWMGVGLAVTAVVSVLVSQSPSLVLKVYHSWLLLLIVEIALVMVISRAVNKLSTAAATGLFVLYAAVNGLVLGVIFLVYAKAAIASAFIVTAGAFGAMSLYGFFTQRDLTMIGRVLIMALFGIIIASVVSFFWHSSALQVIINYAGVLVFAGLTAYDTQKLRIIGEQTQDNPALASRLSIVGSLVLYLDFINLFLFILELMNENRRS